MADRSKETCRIDMVVAPIRMAVNITINRVFFRATAKRVTKVAIPATLHGETAL
jgi:hypothetical protein